MARPQPRFERPQSAPRVAAPPPRSAPAIQRQAPVSRDAGRMERRQEAIQQRQQSVQPRSAPTPSTAASGVQPQRLQQLESRRNLSRGERRELRQLQIDQRQNAQKIQSTDQQKAAASGNPQRLQQLESKGRLSRSERQELRQLRRDERQSVQQNLTADQQKAAATGNQQRLQELQSKGRLTRSEQRELRQLRRDERQNAQQNLTADQQKAAATGNSQRIQELQSKGRLTQSERRELRQLQREERQNARLQERQQQQQTSQTAADRQGRRAQRQAVSAQQVSQGRFASNLAANTSGRRAARRAARLAAQTAWQLGLLAPYVPWRGPVYWPYAYNDVFYYTFWPEAYDSAYWAYAYDDFFDGVFFPDGAPYVEYTAEGPYDGSYARTSTTGAAPRGGGSASGRVSQATREFCADQGITEWPIGRISEAVRPTAEQRTLLENLRKASQEAAAQFRDACPDAVPMTPPGRLQAMTQRLQAASDAVGTVKPALEAFYTSLTDEQKARFNEIGPQLARSQRSQRAVEANNAQNSQTSQANCSSEKAGLSNLAIDRIENLVQPTAAQEAALDRLDEATQKAVEILRDACPNTIPMTPVGRLEVMKQRLDTMIQAANAVRPALEDFYAALSDEQKAKFNRLGRQTAQSGG
jgi:hypothetical protein